MNKEIIMLVDAKVGEVEVTKGSKLSVDEVTYKELISENKAKDYVEAEEKKEIQDSIEQKVKEDKKMSIENKEVQVCVKTDPLKKLGEHMIAMKQGKVSEIVLKNMGESVEVKAQGQSEGTAGDGGNLVYQLPDTIQGALKLQSVIFEKCRKNFDFPEAVFGRPIPYRNESTLTSTSAPRTYEPGEGAAITVTKMAFGLHDLKLGSDKVLVPATDELLSDVSWVESYLLGAMVGKLYWKRDYNILVGAYSAAVQGCIGITHAGAANFLVTPIAHNATYTANIVNKIMSGVDVTLQDGAEWFMSNSTKSTLVGLLGSGTTISTQPIFSDNNTKLAGKPINVMSQMATFGSVDDILYGNFAEYTVGQKGDVVLSMSKDYSFNTDETYFKASIRYQGAPTFRTYTPVDGVAVAAFSTTSGK